MKVEMASEACGRCQASALWTTPNDQRHEESFRELGIQEGEARQQVRRPGICILEQNCKA
jgi:hypothetical protein